MPEDHQRKAKVSTQTTLALPGGGDEGREPQSRVQVADGNKQNAR